MEGRANGRRSGDDHNGSLRHRSGAGPVTNGIEAFVNRQSRQACDDDKSMASERELELIRAAADGDLEGVRILVGRGAKVNARHSNGMTPLLAAALMGRTDVMQFLLLQGADIKTRYRNEATALILAATQGQAPAVRVLLNKGANPNEHARGGSTALLAAAIGGQAVNLGVRFGVERGRLRRPI